MICHDTVTRAAQGADPVGLAVACLAGSPDAAALDRLAGAVAAALPGLSQVRRLAVWTDPDQAQRLDPQTSSRTGNCLIAERDREPLWRDLPGRWSALCASAAADDAKQPQSGEIPGGAPWDNLPATAAGPWILRPLAVQGRTVALVLAELMPAAAPDDRSANGLQLDGLLAALGEVAGGWLQVNKLTAELAQARNDNDSLTRLNRLQGRFVASASHELKTPLTSITAYADVLRGQLPAEQLPLATEFLDVIRAEADRLLRMVHRILDFTRVEYGSRLLTRVPTDITALLVETVRTMQPGISQKRLTVEILGEEGLPPAAADPDLIRQVLVNLVGNAVKFSPPGAGITLTVSELESVIMVNVADEGPGIDPQDVRRIFREFYRADATAEQVEGTGLGLTIARHIVNLHGGHIEARRRPSGGSEFRFMVPKVMGGASAVPLKLAAGADEREAETLIDELLRLVGELTGSRAVALLLRDGRGALVPAGGMGWNQESGPLPPIIETASWTRFLRDGRATANLGALSCELVWRRPDDQAGGLMFAPLGGGDGCPGLLVTARRRQPGPYGEADLAQLTILADVARAALAAAQTSVGPAVEAVRMLLMIRRTGVPTSTPEALDLLARLARRQGVGQSGLRRLLYASALHDAGMARVEEEIVLGGMSLDVDARDEVDRHVEQGVRLMAPLLSDQATADIIRHHHEKYDGSGYPDGLQGHEIPHGARLLAVIDAWFSLTRARPFRAGLEAAAALAEIRAHAGTQFDPAVVEAFAAVLQETETTLAVPPGGGTPGD